jgi:hypothetical protein
MTLGTTEVLELTSPGPAETAHALDRVAADIPDVDGESGRQAEQSTLIVADMDVSDRALIESVRKANKTLSLFVFVLQENGKMSAEDQRHIANMLVALAEVIESRVVQQSDVGADDLPVLVPACCLGGRA